MAESELEVWSPSCPAWVARTNEWIWAGQALAGVTLVVGLAAVLVLYAEGYRMLEARLLLGLFTANFFFALASTIIPVYATAMDEPGTADSCQQSAFDVTPWLVMAKGMEAGAAVMLTAYEVGLMVASILTLEKGMGYVSRRIEHRCHAGVILASVAVGVVAVLMLANYDTTTEYNSTVYLELEAQYVQLFRIGSLVVLMPGCVAVFGMWGYLRYRINQLMQAWEVGRERASSVWRRDHWDASEHTQGLLRNKILLLELQREAWLEVAQPMQKYCAVFLCFSPVYFILSTEFCAKKQVYPTYAKCQFVCNTLMLARSLATVVVFFVDKDRRDAVCNVRTLLSKCWRRVRATCNRRLGVAIGGKVKADVVFADELEAVREYAPAPPMSASFSRDGDGGATLTQDYHLMEDGEK